MRKRYIASVILSLILFLSYFQPFLAYSKRTQVVPWTLTIAVLLGSFFLSIGVAKRRFMIPTCMLVTLLATHFVMIVADEFRGTDHNLFPLELLLVALLALPAYLGTALAAVVDRFRAKT